MGSGDGVTHEIADDDRSTTGTTQRRRLRRWVIGGLALAVSVLVVVLGYGAVVWMRADPSSMDLAGSAGDGTTYLLIGSDERVGIPAGEVARFGTAKEVPGRRADIVLLLRVADNDSVRVLGIPRDLTAFRSGGGPERIAPLLDTGPEAVADGLCNSLGIGVDHVAVIDFAGLAALVDLAHGVDVTTEVALRDPKSGLSLDAGTSRLGSAQALSYVRARTIESNIGGVWLADPDRSAQRPERAVEVLDGLSGALDLSWTNPIRTHRTIWAASGAVQVDRDAGPLDLLGLLGAVRRIDASQVTRLPVVERDGPVPTADLAAGAADAIDGFTGGEGGASRCSTPALLGGG